MLREVRNQILALGLLEAGALVLLWWSFPDNLIGTLVGIVFTVFGLRMLLTAIRRLQTDDSRLFYILHHQPRRIVWVYSVVHEHMPFGLKFNRHGILYIKLVDGSDISVSLPAAKLKLVCKTLSRMLPHASIGYSADLERQYKAMPELLIRDKA